MEKVDVFSLLGKTKSEVAKSLKCGHSEHKLNALLDYLLCESNDIDDPEILEWLTWIIAGGRTPEEFASTVRNYDKTTTCGLVWTENFVAYRCRTCGISPCMALCTDCFEHGNHEGHDVIVFKSETGGACDCGEINIVKESGCCSLHGPGSRAHQGGGVYSSMRSRSNSNTTPPETADLLRFAHSVIPRLFSRLIQSIQQQYEQRMRNSSKVKAPLLQVCKHSMESEASSLLTTGHRFIKMIQGLADMGIVMRQVVMHSLLKPQNYSQPQQRQESSSHEKQLTCLQELVYWTVLFEFPEDLIRLLLSMRSDSNYKEEFTRAFILHYDLIAKTILTSQDPEKLCKQQAKVSVQLFSIENVAVQMVEKEDLLRTVINTLTAMINHAVSSSPVPGQEGYSLKAIDCEHDVMKNNYYWPVKSDLKELFSHFPVAMRFFEEDDLIKQWFTLLSYLQGMNMTTRIKKGLPHVVQETEAHIGAFTAELEISATPMWTLLSHLKDSNTSGITQKMIRHCLTCLKEWYKMCTPMSKERVSFHLPLHRYLSMFIKQAVIHQELTLEQLPMRLMKYIPMACQDLLCLQSSFYQILGRLWARNGSSVLNQAESYINSICCNSMVDADIFLLQVAATTMNNDDFLLMVFEQFDLYTCLGLKGSNDLDSEERNTVVENCLLFLATLTTTRVNMGIDDEHLMSLEMSTLLYISDRLHSELLELLPERCGSEILKNFEPVLTNIAEYQAPRNIMDQGKYVPKSAAWEKYDPIHTLLRSSTRTEFQTSLDRYKEHLRLSGVPISSQNSVVWPPFKMPQGHPIGSIPDPRSVLQSNLMLEILFVVLYKTIHFESLPNLTISLVVYLLELSLSIPHCEKGNARHSGLIYSITSDFRSNFLKQVKFPYNPASAQPLPEESIASLLLQLHRQIRGNGDNLLGSSYSGGACIERLLDKLGSFSSTASPFIRSEIAQNNVSTQNLQKEGEERRKKAKERKVQMMTEMAIKRQQFMEMHEKDADFQMVEQSMLSSLSVSKSAAYDFECVICTEKIGHASFGLISYMVPSPALAHSRSLDPIIENGKTFGQVLQVQYQELVNSNYDDSSIQLALQGFKGHGLSVHTCGHHLHIECFKSYIKIASKSKHADDAVQFHRDRYICPLCRQVGNSFIPVIRNCNSAEPSGNQEVDENQINRALKRKGNLPEVSPVENHALEKLVTNLQDNLNIIQKMTTTSEPTAWSANNNFSLLSPQSLSSLFLSALDNENLKSKGQMEFQSAYFHPLFNVLRYSYKSLPVSHGKKISHLWERVCGEVKVMKGSSSVANKVPLLLHSTSTLLSHLMLQLPFGSERKYLPIICEKLLALRLCQILTLSTMQLYKENVCQLQSTIAASPTYLQFPLARITEALSSHSTSFNSNGISETDSLSSLILRNANDLESFVSRLMTPFAKKLDCLATLLSANSEVQVTTPTQHESAFTINMASITSSGQFERNLSFWCEELWMSGVVTSTLSLSLLTNFDEPRLIEVPNEYDKLFQHSRRVTCKTCNSIPAEPALCLLCGQILCLNSFCCLDKQTKVSELVYHSNTCGLGNAVFICVMSSAILVILGKEACIWGSIYLDAFGEEDLDLRRGRPLYLSNDRFHFLEKQWKTTSFHKYELRWFPHDNIL